MKLSEAALLFLILAAALGHPAHGYSGGGSSSLNHDLLVEEAELPGGRSPLYDAGVHRPRDCCFSYIQQRIRCTNMKDYFLTTSGCSQPGVIFKTRRGKEVCFHPSAGGVLECMEKLASKNIRGRWLAEVKLQ